MIETKNMSEDLREEIEQQKCFGWEETGSMEQGKGKPKLITLARDTNMKHFQEMKVIETTYYGHQNKIKPIPEVDLFVAIILFILCIFPGLFYLSHIDSKKKKVAAYNEQEKEYMKQACLQAKKILSN